MVAKIGIASGAAALLLSGAALAEPPLFPSLAGAVAVQRAPADATAPLAPSELSTLAGGQGVDVAVMTRQQLTGTTTGNTINAGTVTSGSVSFSANALSGFSGVGNFVVNTGANNTLQGAINISVVTAPRS